MRVLTLFYRPLVNTLIISFGLSFLCYLSVAHWHGGGPTDMPLKKTISNWAVVPYILPSWTLALAWISLFKNDRIGGERVLFLRLLDSNHRTGCRTVSDNYHTSLHYFPFAFLLIGGALRNIDAQLGIRQSGWRGTSRDYSTDHDSVNRSVDHGSVLLSFARGLGTFGTPAFLGGPSGNLYCLHRFMETSSVSGQARYLAALVMIVIGMLVLYMDHRMVGARKVL